MTYDELLRTEFPSYHSALAANNEMDFFVFPEILTPPVRVGELHDGNQMVQYRLRQATLKAFSFPWGERWKFCIVPDNYL